MRPLLALVLLIVAVSGGLWLFLRQEPSPGPVEPATSTSKAAPEQRGADPVSPAANAVARTDVGGETRLEGPHIGVLVVNEDAAPVAGAVVRYADPDFDWSSLPSARRSELRILQNSEPEAFLERTGGVTHAGPDGRCRVPARAGGRFQICAREGRLFGIAHGTQGEVTEIVVALARDQSLRVRLVDAAGEPLADQTIAIEPLDENGEAMRSPVPQQDTDDEGRCSFGHLQRIAGNAIEAPAQVRAHFVGGGGPARAFDLLEPPEEEVVLVAEPMGAITVRLLERDGRPVDPTLLGDSQISLAAFAAPPSEPERRGERTGSQSRKLGPDGSVRIAPVVFDRHFKIASFLDDTRTFAGPTAQKPEVAIDLRQTDRGATMTGRLLTTEGPLVTEGFELQLTG